MPQTPRAPTSRGFFLPTIALGALLASCGQAPTELHQVVLVVDTDLCEAGDAAPEFSRIDINIEGSDVSFCATVGTDADECERVETADFPLVLPVVSESGSGTVRATVELLDDAGGVVGCGTGQIDFVSGETRWAALTVPRACGMPDCSAQILRETPQITSLADLPESIRCTPSSPDPVPPIQRLAAGASHACLVDSMSDVFCWGRNDEGQLGLGDTADRSRPSLVEFPASGPIEDIAAGKNHTCAILANGANRVVYCWGDQRRAQTGSGEAASQSPRTTPRPISLTGARQLQLGPEHSCALLANGEVHCWGSNSSGEALGEAGDDLTSPGLVTTMPALTGAVTVLAAGGNNGSESTSRHSCASDGVSGVCWGSNDESQLGRSDTSAAAMPIDAIPADVNQLALGGQQSCATTTAGEVWCWGQNIAPGTLGVETTSAAPVAMATDLGTDFSVLTPSAPTNGPSRSTLAAGDNFRCAIATDGAAQCWGEGTSSRLGSETSTSITPLPITLPSDAGDVSFHQVVVGGSFGCVLPDDGALPFCWGDNSQGQLGRGVAGGSLLPEQLVSCAE